MNKSPNNQKNTVHPNKKLNKVKLIIGRLIITKTKIKTETDSKQNTIVIK